MKLRIRESAFDLGALIKGALTSADLSIFHEFEPPPTGGGHQFLRALWKQAQLHGLKVENNLISRTTRACLLNSFNFSESRLLRTARASVLYVHRMDGPIDVYRGDDRGVDKNIHTINRKMAQKSIFQSRYSLEKHLELGMEFKNPTIILNAADPEIFNRQGKISFSRERKTRLIAVSWSNNLNKGAPDYQWLDEHLDWDRYEMTFVGQSQIAFKNIRMLPAVDSYKLAALLREHDIYITASRHDPCSNSLIEALTCGLPAIYRQSGGHPEIVQQAGVGFEAAEQIPELLDVVAESYEKFQALISLPSIEEVSKRYLQVLELLP